VYHLSKAVHVLCALASFTLFVLRGVWMLRGWSQCMRHGLIAFSLAFGIAQSESGNRRGAAKAPGFFARR
jgi:hypothetical protein